MKFASSLRFRLMAANIIVKQVVILLAALYLLNAFDGLLGQGIGSEIAATAQKAAARLQKSNPDRTPLRELLSIAASAGTASDTWHISRGGESLAYPAGTAPFLMPADVQLTTEASLIDLPPKTEGAPPQAAGLAIDLRAGSPGEPASRLSLVLLRNGTLIEALHRQFRNSVIIALGGIAAMLLTSAWLQVNVGLRPAEMLRSNIERIRLGLARRLDSRFPDELRPLIDETNRLLEAQENAIAHARARAQDLAHGLKTPLSAVTALAEQLKAAGKMEAADEILKNVSLASRHIERELTRSRIAAASGLTYATPLLSAVQRLQHTVETLPGGDELDWEVAIAPDLLVRADEADVFEVCGCLLDNARKWAASRVIVTAERNRDLVRLRIEDDGQGIEERDYARVLRRGLRLDESRPGTGLGLTIVRDVAEAYGGSVALYRSNLGGLGVTVDLPAARPAATPLQIRENTMPDAGCAPIEATNLAV